MDDMSVGRIPLLVRASTYLTNPKLRQEEILKSGESGIGEEIPLLAEEGWTRHEENVPHPIWRGRGGQFGAIFRPEHFAKLTTPSAALRWLRDFLLMPPPPLLCEEGNEDGVQISSDFKLPLLDSSSML